MFGGQSPALDSLIERVNRTRVALSFDRRYGAESIMFRRSDHYTFHERGIATVWFYSGTHPDYHQPSDGLQTLDRVKIRKVAHLMLAVARAIIDAPRGGHR